MMKTKIKKKVWGSVTPSNGVRGHVTFKSGKSAWPFRQYAGIFDLTLIVAVITLLSIYFKYTDDFRTQSHNGLYNRPLDV